MHMTLAVGRYAFMPRSIDHGRASIRAPSVVVLDMSFHDRHGRARGTQPSVGRPTRPLPLSQLLNLSFYWLGLTAIWAGLDATVLPKRMDQLLGDHERAAGPGDRGHGRRGDAHRGPADDGHDLRLHHLALGPPQAVHRHRRGARRGHPPGHGGRRTSSWRCCCSTSCSSSRPTSPRVRSRATCPTWCPNRRSAVPAA